MIDIRIDIRPKIWHVHCLFGEVEMCFLPGNLRIYQMYTVYFKIKVYVKYGLNMFKLHYCNYLHILCSTFGIPFKKLNNK